MLSKASSKNSLKLKKWYKEWKKELSENKYLILLSLIVLVAAEITCFYASTYVDSLPTSPSNDLILDNIPTLSLDFIYAYGFMIVLATALIYTVLFRAGEFHEVAFLFCLLILVRSFFITLTHLGVPADARIVTEAPSFFQSLNFRNDLFFSGHAAMPFMAFLVFRKEVISKFFLIMTVLLSATVLLMHVHYSIDVFSAFFITFGVYKFGEWFISKGYLQTKQQIA